MLHLAGKLRLICSLRDLLHVSQFSGGQIVTSERNRRREKKERESQDREMRRAPDNLFTHLCVKVDSCASSLSGDWHRINGVANAPVYDSDTWQRPGFNPIDYNQH